MNNTLTPGFFKMPDPLDELYARCKKIVDENGVLFSYNGHSFLYDATGMSAEVQNAARILNMMTDNAQLAINPLVDANGMQKVRNLNTGEILHLKVKDAVSENLQNSSPKKETSNFPVAMGSNGNQNPLASLIPEDKAKVYVTKPVDNSQYGVETKPTLKAVVESIVANYVVRSYNQDLYIFTHNPDKYFRMLGDQPQQFIDSHLKKCGQFMMPADIDAVKKALLYDSRLVVREKSMLPDTIWPFIDGLYNIRTNERIENCGEYFITETLRCCYNPAATCEVFDQFVASCAGGNPVIIELIWQVLGYVLSNDAKAKKLFLFTGPKDTGKSLMANTLSSALEEDVVSAMGVNEFGVRFTNAELVDKHLVLCMDIAEEQLTPATVGTIKAITGGDKVRAEAKYKQAISTKIPAKILFGSNHQLQLKTPDAAFADRLVIVPFLLPVPKEAQDKQLFEKLQKEIPGIVAKAAKAYLRLVENNYIFPDVSALIPEHKAVSHQMIISDFIKDCCVFQEDKRILTDDLYAAYTKYTMGKALPALEKSKFSEIVNQICPNVVKKKMTVNGRNANGFIGLCLK